MVIYLNKKRANIFHRLIVCIVLAAFITSSTGCNFSKSSSRPVYKGSALSYMPPPTKVIKQSSYFNLPVLKGIKLYPEDPFKFDFIIDEGSTSLSSKNSHGSKLRRVSSDRLTDEQLKKESKKLIKYFLSSLTIPEEDLWVNLSPSGWVA